MDMSITVCLFVCLFVNLSLCTVTDFSAGVKQGASNFGRWFPFCGTLLLQEPKVRRIYARFENIFFSKRAPY